MKFLTDMDEKEVKTGGKTDKKRIILAAALSFSIFTLFFVCLFSWLATLKSMSAASSQNQRKNEKNIADELYQNIVSNKTTDRYPPNEYFPNNLEPLNYDNFDISAKAYAVMDRDSRELLYAKNLTQGLPISSLAKITTAIVTLENSSLTDVFTVSPTASEVGEASMYLSEGERVTVEELLYGLMLPSGNDAAEVLAEGVGIKHLTDNKMEIDRKKGREWFIMEMNGKAQSIGMMDTYFFNPTGLDEETREKSSFSTALDLLALTNYALSNPTFAKVVSTKQISFPEKKDFNKGFYLLNLLQLDRSFPGIKGVKPGNSVFARETLSSYIERDGRRIIVVLLGSSYTKDDVVKIYKRIFEKN